MLKILFGSFPYNEISETKENCKILYQSRLIVGLTNMLNRWIMTNIKS